MAPRRDRATKGAVDDVVWRVHPVIVRKDPRVGSGVQVVEVDSPVRGDPLVVGVGDHGEVVNPRHRNRLVRVWRKPRAVVLPGQLGGGEGPPTGLCEIRWISRVWWWSGWRGL